MRQLEASHILYPFSQTMVHPKVTAAKVKFNCLNHKQTNMDKRENIYSRRKKRTSQFKSQTLSVVVIRKMVDGCTHTTSKHTICSLYIVKFGLNVL